MSNTSDMPNAKSNYDGTLTYKDVRHTSFGGALTTGRYASVIVRADGMGTHDRVDLDDYEVDLIVRPRFKPHWLRGKYNTSVVIYVDTPEKAKRDYPGDAWELVTVRDK